MTSENNLILLERIINEIIAYYDDLDTLDMYVGEELFDTVLFVIENYKLYFTPVINFHVDKDMEPLEYGFTPKKQIINTLNDLYNG